MEGESPRRVDPCGERNRESKSDPPILVVECFSGGGECARVVVETPDESLDKSKRKGGETRHRCEVKSHGTVESEAARQQGSKAARQRGSEAARQRGSEAARQQG
ncbi:hypothetical protein JHW43_003568 [Diplocarpon mali]|nr:hypothetical protein JHW43_003568 [Diplocarpon mali]